MHCYDKVNNNESKQTKVNNNKKTNQDQHGNVLRPKRYKKCDH